MTMPSKRAVEDGLVFALGGIEDVHGLAMFAASQQKEADVEHIAMQRAIRTSVSKTEDKDPL